MKKTIVILLVLVVVSLACSRSASPAAAEAVLAVTGEPTLTNVLTAAAPASKCARVMAETAQNLRSDADPRSRIITQMVSGDLVQVIDVTNADWWRVKRGDDIGFARSSFLEVVECVP